MLFISWPPLCLELIGRGVGSLPSLNRHSRRIALYFWSALTVLLAMAALLGVSELITLGPPECERSLPD